MPSSNGRSQTTRSRDQRGVVTAELAMALPLLLVITLGLVWLLTLATAQLRAQDAASQTARALARGDDQSVALARGRQVAPERATITIGGGEEVVRVLVRADVPAPISLLGDWGNVTLRAETEALREGEPRDG